MESVTSPRARRDISVRPVRAAILFCAPLAALLLVGCVTSGGSFCDIEHPTRLTSKTIDAMTDAEVADALAHNRKGEKLCGWKPNA